MKVKPLGGLLLLVWAAVTNAQQVKIGLIEYFGTKGVDLDRVRSSMPFREGDFLSFDKFPYFVIEMKTASERVTGHEPTDVAPGCCDQNGNWYIYLGLPGTNSQSPHYHPAPRSKIRFPSAIEHLYEESLDLNMETAKTQAIEDRSNGYALSSYPPLRAKQLAILEYATHHSKLIRRVLSESFEAGQRRAAAQFLGYAPHDSLQINALVKASHDDDETVRNNAVRALGVLAESSQTIARKIPAKDFVLMLNSGNWTDRNKASMLLTALTVGRDTALLRLIRAKASDSLLEMSRWREYGHASYSRIILGRIAGIEEKELQKLAHNDVNAIIAAFVASH